MKSLINFKSALVGRSNTKFRKIKLLMCGSLFLLATQNLEKLNY